MTHRKKLSCSATALILAVAFTACGRLPGPPARLGLKLPPNALGTSINLQQHLTIEHEGRIVDLDVALEVDEREVNLVGLVLGRRVLTLRYDGSDLEMWRDPMIPPQLRGEDVLEDLQLTLWPIDSIREALPNGWQIEENDRHRALFWNSELVMLIYYTSEPRWSGEVVLRNMRYQYKLTIITALQHAFK
jgi:Protein of unknown function (DUF3261)